MQIISKAYNLYANGDHKRSRLVQRDERTGQRFEELKHDSPSFRLLDEVLKATKRHYNLIIVIFSSSLALFTAHGSSVLSTTRYCRSTLTFRRASELAFIPSPDYLPISLSVNYFLWRHVIKETN